METRRGGKHWARKGNSRSSRKNRIDACIRIYGDEYEVEDRKEKENVPTDLGISLIKGDRVNSNKYEM